jgi:small conductance mechanosensitive channel
MGLREMANNNFFELIITWFDINIIPFLISILTVVIAYLIYLFLKKQISRLERKESIDKTNAKNLLSLLKITVSIVIITLLSIQFSETFSVYAGIFTVAAGTVIGFAAMNTLGNVISGLIIMVSKPFKVGDRIMFRKRLAEVIDIKLVYTVLKDIDGIIISVPNLQLLKVEIENYGQDRILRRNIKISVGYDVDPRLVEKAMLDASAKFTNILKFPEPRVDVFDYSNYAIEYRLIVFINNSKIIPKFDYDLRKAVFYSCKDYKIDLSTPSLIKSITETGKKPEPPDVSIDESVTPVDLD